MRRAQLGVIGVFLVSLLTALAVSLLVQADDTGIPLVDRGYATENTYLPLFKNLITFLLISTCGLYLLAYVGVRDHAKHAVSVGEQSRHGKYMAYLLVTSESQEAALTAWQSYYEGLTDTDKLGLWYDYLVRQPEPFTVQS